MSRKIEKTKEVCYDVLEGVDYGWHEEQNAPTLFIRYMLKAILVRYTEFEERVSMINDSGTKIRAYDMARYMCKKRTANSLEQRRLRRVRERGEAFTMFGVMPLGTSIIFRLIRKNCPNIIKIRRKRKSVSAGV